MSLGTDSKSLTANVVFLTVQATLNLFPRPIFPVGPNLGRASGDGQLHICVVVLVERVLVDALVYVGEVLEDFGEVGVGHGEEFDVLAGTSRL